MEKDFGTSCSSRNDSYLETSATAIYVYCLAHAINKGWIDAIAYGPVAQLGWHAVAGKINEEGQVEGTCVGTGMAFDPAFYYYRPVNVYAGAWIRTGALGRCGNDSFAQHQHPQMNDSARAILSGKAEDDSSYLCGG